MEKLELLNKLNKIIDEKYIDVLYEIFEKMIDERNIYKNIETFINIETGEILTEVYNGWEPLLRNEYCIAIGYHKGFDITDAIYEDLTEYEKLHYTEKLEISSEYLKNKDIDDFEFKELLKSTGKIEEFEAMVTEVIFENIDIEIRDLELEDLEDLEIDFIEI